MEKLHTSSLVCLMKQAWEEEACLAKYILLSHLRITEFKLLLQLCRNKVSQDMIHS